jgi:hypothetical protein
MHSWSPEFDIIYLTHLIVLLNLQFISDVARSPRDVGLPSTPKPFTIKQCVYGIENHTIDISKYPCIWNKRYIGQAYLSGGIVQHMLREEHLIKWLPRLIAPSPSSLLLLSVIIYA